MSSINQKFGLKSTAIEEWIPWGGIIRPSVMKQKDGSLFSIIQYEPYSYFPDEEYPFFSFRRGWVLWQEVQYIKETGKFYLVICWNPFVSSSKYVGNSLRPNIRKEKVVDYFESEISRILKAFSSLTTVKLLKYQEIMDVLSFSLSHGESHEELPEIPLYMDALLSEDIDIKFGANNIYINGKHVYVVSLLSPWPTDKIYYGISHMTYRHSRRLICFGTKESKNNIAKYTSHWCLGRKVIRKMALDHILSRYNGYYTDSFQFLLNKEDDLSFRKFFEHLLDSLGVNYLVQSYGLKDTFWGSIPGLFLANTKPPLIGFSHISEFLESKKLKHEDETNILEDVKSSLVPTTVDVEQYFSSVTRGEVDVQA